MPAVWQANVIDLAGNALPAASIEVREQISGTLVPLFSDFALGAPIGNPFVTDGFGFARFFVVVNGLYRIQATKGGFTRVWEYVLLMTLPIGGYVPTGVITPVPLAAGANNDFDADLDADFNLGRVRFAGDAGGTSVLTGLQNGTDGRRIIGTNVGTEFIVPNESALSLAVNRFAMNGDLFWPAGASHEFVYDSAVLTGRWSKLGN